MTAESSGEVKSCRGKGCPCV